MTPAGDPYGDIRAAPRERVYDKLTQAENLETWFTTGAEHGGEHHDSACHGEGRPAAGPA